MMKANGINPNGGPSSLPAQSSAPGSPSPKKGTATPNKSKATGGSKTGTPRKRTATKADRGPAKKVKAEADTEGEAGGESSLVTVKEEADRMDVSSLLKAQMRSKHDPFLSPDSDTAIGKSSEEDAALFNEFCNTHSRSEEVGSEIGDSHGSDLKHGSFLAGTLEEDEIPLVKEEEERAGG